MKANKYIQPIVEVMTIHVASSICAVSVNAPLSTGGGSTGTGEYENIDPGHSL